eukprot:scaffold2776_cov262-Ochromonas_danica.AAC.1
MANTFPSSQQQHGQRTSREVLYQYETCLLFCSLVAKTCGGNLIHDDEDESGLIRFCIPVRAEASSQSEWVDSAVVSNGNGNSSSSSGQHEVKRSLQKIDRAVIEELCVFSHHRSLTELTVQALQSIVAPEDYDDIPVFEQLNMADMYIHRIVIVTSLHACMELRNKGYRGYIVLLSDRLAYLDDGDGALYDYVLSISSSESQLEGLSIWLNSMFSVQQPSSFRSIREEEIGSPYDGEGVIAMAAMVLAMENNVPNLVDRHHSRYSLSIMWWSVFQSIISMAQITFCFC